MFAARYEDSNAQNPGTNNDCHAELLSLVIGIKERASANCLNDINSVQDSGEAAISTTPFNAAPTQASMIDDLNHAGTIQGSEDWYVVAIFVILAIGGLICEGEHPGIGGQIIEYICDALTRQDLT
ncbi:MAG TPA: hypothetical protein VE130_02810 [Nitrososphaeraceae archaeon]|nr:hypothetical protein [Nitrososphaeraceae archaeon]